MLAIAAIQDLGPRCDPLVLNPFILHVSDVITKILRRSVGHNFRNQGSAQRFLATHAAVYNTFNVQRHLIRRSTLRVFRAEANRTWAAATAAA
jgi:transposase-like protein